MKRIDSNCPRVRILFLSALEVLLMSSLGQTQEPSNHSSLKDRFLQEAPVRWKEYSRKTEELQGTFSSRISTTLDDAKSNFIEYKVRKGRDGRQLIYFNRTSSVKNQGKTFEVFGLNPHYSFVLQQKNPASDWAVTELKVFAKQSSLDVNLRKVPVRFECPLNDLVEVGARPLVDMVQQPGFQIIQCHIVAESGEELVEVLFDYPHAGSPGENPIQGGSLLLDPKRFWCLRSANVRRKSPQAQGNLTFRVLSLEETTGGLPVPKSAIQENEVEYSDGNKGKIKWEFHYDLKIPRQLPEDDEFTLSAFGLHEPLGYQKKPARLYLWAALGSLICFALAALFRWLAQRGTNHVAP